LVSPYRRRTLGRLLVVLGEGPVKDDLVHNAGRCSLGNTTFLPQMSIDEVTPYINGCDILLVPLRRLKILDTFVPSKLFDFLACAKPVILMVDGEARRILGSAGGGVFVEPENAEALCATLERVRQEPEWLVEAGRRGRRYVLEYHSRDAQAKILEKVLLQTRALSMG
jgi:glycosyltransferase involved in cell wall biosynthesis